MTARMIRDPLRDPVFLPVGTTTGTEEKPLSGVRVIVILGSQDLFGQERGTIEVIRSLSDFGLRALFLISSQWGRTAIEPELKRHNFSYQFVPFGYHWGRYLCGKYFYYVFRNTAGLLATSWRAWRAARKWQATHVYCANFLHFSYVAPALGFLEIPLIVRCGDAPPSRSRVQAFLFMAMLKRSAHVVCISEYIRRLVQAFSLKPRCEVIYSVPPRRVVNESGSAALQKVDGVLKLLYVGQIARFKGLDLLVEALQLLRVDGTKAQLFIAGSAPWQPEYLADLQARIGQMRLEEDVHFLGYVDEIDAIFEACDLHVCPSICGEALGNVVLEAKRAGRPSVVFPDGGLPELIEQDVDGFVCRECTSAALAEGICYFSSAERRKVAGRAAAQSLERKFSRERFVQQWTKVFQTT